MNARPENLFTTIRPMEHADVAEVVALEERSYDFPWSRGIFSDCLIAGYPSAVVEINDTVVGYSIMSVAAAEGHILNLCVDPSLRRLGLGQRLLDHLLVLAEEFEVERLFLEVRPSNAAAIQLYERAGFTHIGVRKDYYRAAEGREDALVLVRDFNG